MGMPENPDHTGEETPVKPKATRKPRAAAKPKPVVPPQTELSVSYSIGTKVNIGNYESVDTHLSRSEKYDVTGLSPEEIDKLWHTRYQALHDDLGELILAEKNEILGVEDKED